MSTHIHTHLRSPTLTIFRWVPPTLLLGALVACSSGQAPKPHTQATAMTLSHQEQRPSAFDNIQDPKIQNMPMVVVTPNPDDLSVGSVAQN